MAIKTKSLTLTNKWQQINVNGTTTLTISSRAEGRVIQPFHLCISSEELEEDAVTEDYIVVGNDGSPTTISGLGVGDYVYVRGVGSISNKIGIIRDETPEEPENPDPDPEPNPDPDPEPDPEP